ncbi:ROK family transcriptional regulator [Aidingimonas halophila]|uniref:Sugar kinase of the NBD/HSP70 family, may contain an N-terminal HTH domain n=1 Tax=Aidingimonas halophila TaxID=574349 RepID=A0A1H3BV74_9GAMM|nr:ROK family transcriptional regulator [Aidingimonas halophila]GHC27191.1 transcriptional regulator [Aidingimonas halophila]SDX45645.1 Sugar kinase of the NBD/HSP70 family, may contain an N-terminal HTH domain [Aidingimonas halophila]
MTLPLNDITRRDNTLALLRSLRTHGPTARVDLGAMNGISSATVTSITADLLKQELIVELPHDAHRNGGRGRPKTLIELNRDAACVICVKLSINEVQIVVGDFSGHIRHSAHFTLTTQSLTPAQLSDFLETRISEVHATMKASWQRVAGICLAVQGVVSPVNGTIIWSPALGFRNASFADHLADVFNCPVLLENDANCIARILAEQPEYSSYPNLVVIMLGYGIGMSVLIDGKPFLGSQGSAAEFGHSKYEPGGALCACGRRGCIEAYTSDYALYREARSMLALPAGDSAHPSHDQMQTLTQLALQGDPVARQIYDKAGRALGFGIANVLALFNPDLVLITGSGVRGYDAMRPSLERALREALVDELIGASQLATCPWERDMTCLGGIAMTLQAIEPDLLVTPP